MLNRPKVLVKIEHFSRLYRYFDLNAHAIEYALNLCMFIVICRKFWLRYVHIMYDIVQQILFVCK